MPNLTKIETLGVETFIIRQESDVILFTSQVRWWAIQVDMSSLNQTMLITAASELARNMLNHAKGGDAQVEHIRQGLKEGVRLIFTDKGPGIADINQAMQEGYSTGTGMGLGLSGAKRLANEFLLTSTVGQGTTVTIIRWTNG